MSILDGVRWLVGREAPSPVPQLRSTDTLDDWLQLARYGSRSPASPWRQASTREAMGVPAVFKAVSLIANTTGTLSMEGFQNGSKLDAANTPRVIIRPDPMPGRTPYDFWRDSTYHKARRGETWWWIAKRDFDGQALSILTLDPREITVERNKNNVLRPIIRWLGQEMPNDDMRLMKYLPDPNDPYRGIGPLQACGAAVSVAVEAQEYAANFFAGSPSNTWIKAAIPLDAEEAGLVKAAWVADSGNLPKVTDNRIDDVKDIGVDPEKAQLSDIRLHQNGEVALMFSMPSTLLNFAVQGSTITYQNVGQVADDLLRQCLLPHYLEPMEQVMTDLLPRSLVGRFNVEGLRRADIKTRFDVHKIAIDAQIYDADYAAQQEGILPGDVENRPVPFGSPAAVPSTIPQLRSRLTPKEVHCRCGKLVGKLVPPYEVVCQRCKSLVAA